MVLRCECDSWQNIGDSTLCSGLFHNYLTSLQQTQLKLLLVTPSIILAFLVTTHSNTDGTLTRVVSA